MIKIYGNRVKKKYLKEIFRDLRKIIFYEKDKLKKIYMYYRAYRDFKKNITGKIKNKYI